MAEVIDCKAVAADVIAKVTRASNDLAVSKNVTPGLAVIIVGEDPASQVYVAAKSRTAKECGFNSLQHTLPADTSEAYLID
ncbi:bifunctional methylenetetrahydrofolate dehydrogenase/methenyltetrahydrofolate cyclohydrolase, partial [Mesorhizobium sp. M2D.F.Ca.ET.223.01.1.1]|uniref:tetrahydrofolate dehydrogenase/cyclohydrolase catalytic domain-containing protein n=1 Tax=Mesorhizobium sp. M2D.F.Ca.ET.223.01.1.1 TaxID=2563940 RepID=UPI0011349CF0